jgi:hypothetical protein
MVVTIRWLQKEKLSRIKAKGNSDMRTFTIFLVLVSAAGCLHVNAQTRGVISAKTQELYLDYSHLYQTKDVPVIQWENPIKQLQMSKERQFLLKVQINSSSEIEDVNVWINGEDVNNRRGFAIVKATNPQGFNRRINTTITLAAGENVVTVTASNKSGGTASSSRYIHLDANDMVAKAMNRNDRAILFATNSYEHWDNLVNPANDALAIAEELKSAYGFEVEIVNNPTRKEVLQVLRNYSRMSYMPNDQLFIFFAGHGHYDELFNQGYLVCSDTRKADEEKLSYLPYSNLREIVNNIPNEHIFLAIDACFGGAFDPFIKNSTMRGGDDGIYDELDLFEFINRKLKFKTRKFLTSGGKEYVPDGRPGSHSPFVRKLLEALRSYGGADKVLTLDEIKIYLEKITPEPRYGEFGSNEPGSDFIFVAQ